MLYKSKFRLSGKSLAKSGTKIKALSKFIPLLVHSHPEVLHNFPLALSARYSHGFFQSVCSCELQLVS